MMLQLLVVVATVLVTGTNAIPGLSCILVSCQHTCRNELIGYRCICDPGYSVDPNNDKKCLPVRANCQPGLENDPSDPTTCRDINECSLNMCDQLCKNSHGSYTCSCKAGYRVDPNNRGRCLVDAPACAPGYTQTATGCVDIDECQTNMPCDQTCFNLPGSYRCSCRAGFEINELNNNRCSQIQICTSLADIVIVLDSSGSMGTKNNELQLTFASRFIDHFQVGNSKVRFGAILFSDFVEKLFDLNVHATTADASDAIRRADYHQGTTRTDLAFDFVRNGMFSTPSGGRSNAPDIVVVFTDGQSTNPTATLTAADSLKRDSAKIIAVGIGNDVSLPELRQIASSRDDVFGAPSFEMLDYIEQKLAKRVCSSA